MWNVPSCEHASSCVTSGTAFRSTQVFSSCVYWAVVHAGCAQFADLKGFSFYPVESFNFPRKRRGKTAIVEKIPERSLRMYMFQMRKFELNAARACCVGMLYSGAVSRRCAWGCTATSNFQCRMRMWQRRVHSSRINRVGWARRQAFQVPTYFHPWSSMFIGRIKLDHLCNLKLQARPADQRRNFEFRHWNFFGILIFAYSR